MDIEPVCWCIAKGLHVHKCKLLPLSAVIDINIGAHSFFHLTPYIDDAVLMLCKMKRENFIYNLRLQLN